MKKLILGAVLLNFLCLNNIIAQEGQSINNVKVLTTSGDTITLPYYGQKGILIFYADPSKPSQNLNVRNYFKQHPINSPYVISYGVINLQAAPLIPRALIVKRAQAAIAGTNANVYLDPNSTLINSWHLNGAEDNFAIIFINKECTIEYYKSGQLSTADQTNLLNVINTYLKKPD